MIMMIRIAHDFLFYIILFLFFFIFIMNRRVGLVNKKMDLEKIV